MVKVVASVPALATGSQPSQAGFVEPSADSAVSERQYDTNSSDQIYQSAPGAVGGNGPSSGDGVDGSSGRGLRVWCRAM